MRDLFPEGLKKDTWGNYVYTIGQSRTIFAAHLDTVSKDFVKVKHIIDGNIIRTDGKTTLGADDKAGITVMLWMIKNEVPGNYYFLSVKKLGVLGQETPQKGVNSGESMIESFHLTGVMLVQLLPFNLLFVVVLMNLQTLFVEN